MKPLPLLPSLVFVFLSFASDAPSQELNAARTQDLLFRGPWHIQTGGEINYFIWDREGTLCVRMFDPGAESCEDTGEWTGDGAEICYSLEWWGAGVDLSELCFTVAEGDEGQYEAKDQTGLTALAFTVPGAE